MKADSNTAVTPAYLRAADAARYLGIAPRTLREWQRRRVVAFHKPSNRVALFAVSDLDRAMQRFRIRAIGDKATA